MTSFFFVNVGNPAQLVVPRGSFDKFPSKITDPCLTKFELKLEGFVARGMDEERGAVIVHFGLTGLLFFQQQPHDSYVYTKLFFISEEMGMCKEVRL
jgi:hypothetical protein